MDDEPEVLACPSCGAEYDEDAPPFERVFDAIMARADGVTTRPVQWERDGVTIWSPFGIGVPLLDGQPMRAVS